MCGINEKEIEIATRDREINNTYSQVKDSLQYMHSLLDRYSPMAVSSLRFENKSCLQVKLETRLFDLNFK